MKRTVVFALKDTTHRGVAIRKGGILGEDERPWPAPDGVTWWSREVVEREDPPKPTPARRPPPGPKMAAPKPPANAEPDAKLGDAAHPFPASPSDDSQEEYDAWQERLRVARERVAAENAARKKEVET